MSASFDPYYIWLGIPPDEQPPNHYRLLGLVRGESNVEVIDAAANRQTAYLHDMASGPHRRECQKILNEIATARRLLLDADRKAKYDAKLAESEAATTAAEPQAAEPPAEAPKTGGSKTISIQVEKQSVLDKVKPAERSDKRDPTFWIWVGTGVAALLVLIVFVVAWPSGAGTSEEVTASKDADDDDTPAENDQKAESEKTESDKSNDAADAKKDDPKPNDETKKPADGGTKPTGGGKPMPTPPKPAPKPAQAKLVGHWTFDAKKKNVVAASGTKAKATLTNGSEIVDGPTGPAVALNGWNQSLEIPKGAFTPKAGSLAFWVRPALEEGPEPIFAVEGLSLLIQRQPDSELSVRFGSAPKDAAKDTVKGGTLLGGHWYHVAVTWKANGSANVYLDGKAIGTIPAIGALKPATKALFGMRKWTSHLPGRPAEPAPYPTAVADVRLYDGVLPAAKVQGLFASASKWEPVEPLVTKPVNFARLPPGSREKAWRQSRTGTQFKSTWDVREKLPKDKKATGKAIGRLAVPEQKTHYGQRVTGYLVPPRSGYYEFTVDGAGADLFVSRNDAGNALGAPYKSGERRFLRSGRLYWYEVIDRSIRGKGGFNVGWVLPGGEREETISSEYLAYPFHRREFVPVVVDNVQSWRDAVDKVPRSEGATKFADTKSSRVLVANPKDSERNEIFEVVLDPRMRKVTAITVLVERHDALPGGGPGVGLRGKCEIREIELEVFEPEGTAAPRRVALAPPRSNWPPANPELCERALDGDPETGWPISADIPGRVWLLLVPKEPLKLAAAERLKLTVRNEDAVGNFVVEATSWSQGTKLPGADQNQLDRVFAK